MTRSLIEAVQSAIPNAKVAAEVIRNQFGSMDTGKSIVTLPVEDWTRIVTLATLDDPPPTELVGPDDDGTRSA